MNKKIAFVVVALVVLVATFCVSFAGMPLDIITPVVDVTLPLSDIPISSSWEGDMYVDLTLAQNYAAALYSADLMLAFVSPSDGIAVSGLTDGVWQELPFTLHAFTVESSETGDQQYQVSSLISWDSGTVYERVYEGTFRFSLPLDTDFLLYIDGVLMDDSMIEENLPFLPSALFGFMEFVPSVPPSLGQIVIDNIIDTLWGTVVSVGDSFGEGMNQMVGDLFFDLETGDLSAFSIVIICFFALCLLVTIVNWLFFRLTNIKKF